MLGVTQKASGAADTIVRLREMTCLDLPRRLSSALCQRHGLLDNHLATSS